MRGERRGQCKYIKTNRACVWIQSVDKKFNVKHTLREDIDDACVSSE